MIKIVWLAQYNVNNLAPELILNRTASQHSSSWIQNLSNQLALYGDLELHIITHTPLVDMTQHIKKENIYFHVVRYAFPFTNRGFPWYLPFDKLSAYYQFSRQARSVLKSINPDVIHVHGTEGGYFKPCYRSRIPVILSIQGIIHEILKIDFNLTGLFQLSHESFAIRNARYFGCRTKFDSDFVRARNKNAVIFDLPEAMNRAFFLNVWKPSSKLSLVFVGTITKRKGIEELISAIEHLKSEFPTILLKVIGTGSATYIRHIKKKVSTAGLQDNVLWLGIKQPNQIATELACSTIFVLPSWMDNSPNSLAEAMAVGIPSIATKVGGIPSMISNDYDGLLFQKNNIHDLTGKIRQLLIDVDLQKKFSENSKRKAIERNFPESVANKYLKVYRSLAGSNLKS